MHGDKDESTEMLESFVEEYNSSDALLKYGKDTAGYGINYLLQEDYARVYSRAIESLHLPSNGSGLRVLEFGCGAGMNLLSLVGLLKGRGIRVDKAYGTDFSPTLIAAAKSEAKETLSSDDLERIRFCVARNETLLDDLSTASGDADADLLDSFDLILGINTFRYCHRLGKSGECAADISRLLKKGGVCIMIDMNRNFPFFRSRFKRSAGNPAECYLPSLDEYAAPFVQAGFEILEKDTFCWIPHSAGPRLVSFCRMLSPMLNLTARKFAIRSLVISRKPLQS
jgi:SAM-dependent methyltransferase